MLLLDCRSVRWNHRLLDVLDLDRAEDIDLPVFRASDVRGLGGSSAGAVAVVGRSGLRSLGFPWAAVFGCRDRSVSSARP